MKEPITNMVEYLKEHPEELLYFRKLARTMFPGKLAPIDDSGKVIRTGNATAEKDHNVSKRKTRDEKPTPKKASK